MLLDMQVPEGSKVVHSEHGKGIVRFNESVDGNPRTVCVEFESENFQWLSPVEQYESIVSA